MSWGSGSGLSKVPLLWDLPLVEELEIETDLPNVMEKIKTIKIISIKYIKRRLTLYSLYSFLLNSGEELELELS